MEFPSSYIIYIHVYTYIHVYIYSSKSMWRPNESSRLTNIATTQFAAVCSNPCPCQLTHNLGSTRPWRLHYLASHSDGFVDSLQSQVPQRSKTEDYLKSASVIRRDFTRGRASCPFQIPHKHSGRYIGEGCVIASWPCQIPVVSPSDCFGLSAEKKWDFTHSL